MRESNPFFLQRYAIKLERQRGKRGEENRSIHRARIYNGVHNTPVSLFLPSVHPSFFHVVNHCKHSDGNSIYLFSFSSSSFFLSLFLYLSVCREKRMRKKEKKRTGVTRRIEGWSFDTQRKQTSLYNSSTSFVRVYLQFDFEFRRII